MGSFGPIANKLSILVPKIPTVNSEFCRSLSVHLCSRGDGAARGHATYDGIPADGLPHLDGIHQKSISGHQGVK